MRAEADVCVVGAGYAGLVAARQLRRAGKTVVVCEARDRVGGRIWTASLSDGTPVDRGGAWVGPRHDAIAGLAAEIGISTYKTWNDGAHLLIGDGKVRRYHGLIPKIGPLAVLSIARAQNRLDRVAKRLPVDAPWDAPDAKRLDGSTIASELERLRVRSGIAHDLFDMAIRGLFTGDLANTSLLNLVFLVRSAGSMSMLLSIDNGYQENMVDGGAGSMARRIADDLGDAVCLNSPVRAIKQRGDRVEVEMRDLTVTARHTVVAIPPVLLSSIAFEPAMPPDRAALYRGTRGGPETKTLVVYDEPFWRDEECSGQTAEPGSAAEVTIDASPMSGSPGVLACFTFGHVAERIDALPAGERRRAVLDALVGRFGPRAAEPRDFVETRWWTEEWTRGCSMAHWEPGVLTKYGRLLREPWGRIHWAGTETSAISYGSMDGAVRSGERAAAEILEGA